MNIFDDINIVIYNKIIRKHTPSRNSWYYDTSKIIDIKKELYYL